MSKSENKMRSKNSKLDIIEKKINEFKSDTTLEEHYHKMFEEMNDTDLKKFLKRIAHGVGTVIDLQKEKINPFSKSYSDKSNKTRRSKSLSKSRSLSRRSKSRSKSSLSRRSRSRSKSKGGAAAAITLPNDAAQRSVHPPDCIATLERLVGSPTCEQIPSSCQWPDNYGCLANPTTETLAMDSKFDRFGQPHGFYAGGFEGNPPQAATFVTRSMGNPTISCSAQYGALGPYNVYKVLLPIDALVCRAAPWFDKPGGAIQYVFLADKHIASIRASLLRLQKSDAQLAFIKKVTEIVAKGAQNPWGSQRYSAPRHSSMTVENAPILFNIQNLIDSHLIAVEPSTPPPFQ